MGIDKVTGALPYISSLSARKMASRVIDPMLEYKFSRAECLSGSASDSGHGVGGFGHLKINTSEVICPGLGVRAKQGSPGYHRIVSNGNSTVLMKHLVSRGNGWSVELWANLDDFYDCPGCLHRHLVSIGNTNETESSRARHYACNFLLYQSNVESSVGISLPMKLDYLSIEADKVIEWGSPVHLVFTLEPDPTVVGSVVARWYVNSTLSRVLQIIDPLPNWEEGFHLQVLNNPVAVRDSPFFASPRGTIFLLAMHNRAINSSEVAQNYASGLDNSPPVAGNITAIINEDGEVGDHYDTPEYYLRDPSVPTLNLSTISLVVSDLDEEGFPGFDQSPPPASVFVESLPARGTLYDVYGEEIHYVPRNIPYDYGYRLRYRPVKDEFSGPEDVYVSVTYSAVDSITGERSVVPGVLDIHVLAKNDPPQPVNLSETVTAGKGHIVRLQGTDIESSLGDRIDGAIIEDMPKHGVLYQVRLHYNLS